MATHGTIAVEAEVVAAIIGIAGVILGFIVSEIRAAITHRAQQTAMLFETLHSLSGKPNEIVTGAAIALKFQKRNKAFHEVLIPILLAGSLRLSEKELGGETLTREEKYALYVVWCVLGSISATRGEGFEEHYQEFSYIQDLYLKTSVGTACRKFAETKSFVWLQHG